MLLSIFSGGPSVTIKSHQCGWASGNDGIKLVEPLRELFKDEKSGKELGLPKDLINRHPFQPRFGYKNSRK